MRYTVPKGLTVLLLLMHALIAYGEELKLPPMHHVVRVTIPEGMKITEQVRLNEKDEIDCISCHGIEDIAETPADQIDREHPDFFVDGPLLNSKMMGAFCARCHNSKESERANIHILLDSLGKPIEERCTFCHLEVPDTEAKVSEGQVNESARLRLSAEKLCFGCHLKTPHLNSANHLVKMPTEPPQEMVKYLKQQSEKGGYRLPLSDGHITCITCHTSHQRGVLKREEGQQKQVEERPLKDGVGYADHPWNKVVAADKRSRIDELAAGSVERMAIKKELKYRRLTHEVLLRAPAKDGTLCLLCHEFEK